ncbi:GHKL domain-containing protein [Dethiosulfatibacter aminovorans DSM 17477]|uniref:GHKL domain-containing protein n=1 Tax=Dethiosulfatibacter aminovorans DSM 17477 TaxID=1121476 RepID=A0A1M6GFI8_9FIRM|nr:GHKL domain-containing protein [Dethiosulfatibacter aminovorans]SHJ08734.1 GHKL domain-containing protein [Dethiosulfatibacter aminovorans DSM 17477]
MSGSEIFVISLFDMSMMAVFIHGMLTEYKTSGKRKILYIVGGSVTIALNSVLAINQPVSHIGATIIFFAAFMLYVSKFEDLNRIYKTILFLFISVVLFVVQAIVMLLLSLIFKNFAMSFEYGLFAQTLGLLLVYLMSKYMSFSKIFVYLYRKNIVFSVVVFNLYVIQYGLSMSLFSAPQDFLEMGTEVFLLYVMALITNMFLVKEGIAETALHEKVQFYDTYIPIIKNVMREVRKKQHDYNSQVNVMKTLRDSLKGDKKEVVESYVKEIENENIWVELLNLNNDVLIALLYSKYISAKEKGVDLKFKIRNNYFESVYSDYKIVEMYGILIDNAIEAVEGKADDKKVNIEMEFDGKNNKLKVENPSEFVSLKEFHKFFEPGYSRKKGKNRGLGLDKLKEILKEKNGTISYMYDNTFNSVVFELQHS